MTTEHSPALEARSDEVGVVIEKFINSEEFTYHARTENSQSAYAGDLRFFTNYCQQHGVLTFSELKPEFLKVWLKDLEIKFKPATVARKIASLKILRGWAVSKNLLKQDFFENLPPIEVPKRVGIEILSPNHQQALIAEAKKENNLRDETLIRIALQTGASTNEIVGLNYEDVTEKSPQGKLLIRFKGVGRRRGRVVEVDSKIEEVITRYLRQRNLEIGQPLFTAEKMARGRRLTRQGFWLISKNYGKRIGVPNLNPRILRNTFAANFTEGPTELAKVLGIDHHSGVIFQSLAKKPNL